MSTLESAVIPNPFSIIAGLQFAAIRAALALLHCKFLCARVPAGTAQPRLPADITHILARQGTVMNPTIKTHLARNAAGAALGIVALVSFVTEAAAVSPRVRSACTGDYFAYCSQHDPDGPDVRRCMRANGLKLSNGCLQALIAAGEVSKREVARRAATK
jgi:hypothetical protein